MKNFIYAFKYFLKSGSSNIARVFSLAIGILVGTTIFSLVTFNLTFDRFIPDRERVFQMWTDVEGMNDAGSSLVAPIAPYLQMEMPQVEAATRLWWEGESTLHRDKKAFDANARYVDSMFFDVLDYGVLRGDARAILGQKGSVMISQSLAKMIFGDSDPVGEQLIFNETTPVTVRGIFSDIPANTWLERFDLLLSFEDMPYPANWESWDSYPTFIKLAEGASIAEVQAGLDDFFERHGQTDQLREWKQSHFFVPITKSNTTGNDNTQISLLMAAIGFLAFFIACMNYILISISLLARRSKTIATLKCNGARQKDIMAISLWETAMIVIAALLVALIFIMIFENLIGRLTGVAISDLFAIERIWTPLAVILLAFLISGLIPARIFAAVPVTMAFRESRSGRKGWKQTLLFMQLTAATLVTAFLFITLKQYNHISRGDFGYNPRDIVILSPLRATGTAVEAFKGELMSMPEVINAGISGYIPIEGFGGNPAYDENTGELLFSCRYGTMDETYIETMGMEIADGRNFMYGESGLSVIINEKYAEERGWNDSPVGKQIRDGSSSEPPYFTVVGVVKDFWTDYMGNKKPLVYHPMTAWWEDTDPEEPVKSGYIMIRVHEISPQVMSVLEDKVKTFAGEQLFTLTPYEALLAKFMEPEKRFNNIIAAGSLATLIIVITGLVGYLGDEIRRRKKEVAIRKVNGAGNGDIFRIITSDTAKTALPAIIVGLAGAFLIGRNWLNSFEERTVMSWWIFMSAAICVVLIIFVTEIIKTWKITVSNPADILRKN